MADSTVPADTTAEALQAQPSEETSTGSSLREAVNRMQAAANLDPGLPTDPAQLQGMIHTLRSENAKSRVNAKEQAAAEARDQVVQQIGKALGLINNPDNAPTVEALTAKAEDATRGRETAELHLAVYKAAHAAGADPERMLDSVSFLNSINGTSPTDTDAINTAVQQWTTDNQTTAAGGTRNFKEAETPAFPLLVSTTRSMGVATRRVL